MRWVAIAVALSACAHLPVSTDFTRAVDAAVEQGVDEFLKAGRCSTARLAVTCDDSSTLVMPGIEAVYFDRDGKRVGRSSGPHLKPTKEGQTPACTREVRAEDLCARAEFRVKRVSVALKLTHDSETIVIDVRPGQRIELGSIEATVGYSPHGPIVISLRRVPEGVSVLAGAAHESAMHQVYERAVIQLPAHVTLAHASEWSEFTIEISREGYELDLSQPVPLAVSPK